MNGEHLDNDHAVAFRLLKMTTVMLCPWQTEGAQQKLEHQKQGAVSEHCRGAGQLAAVVLQCSEDGTRAQDAFAFPQAVHDECMLRRSLFLAQQTDTPPRPH